MFEKNKNKLKETGMAYLKKFLLEPGRNGAKYKRQKLLKPMAKS